MGWTHWTLPLKILFEITEMQTFWRKFSYWICWKEMQRGEKGLLLEEDTGVKDKFLALTGSRNRKIGKKIKSWHKWVIDKALCMVATYAVTFYLARGNIPLGNASFPWKTLVECWIQGNNFHQQTLYRGFSLQVSVRREVPQTVKDFIQDEPKDRTLDFPEVKI